MMHARRWALIVCAGLMGFLQGSVRADDSDPTSLLTIPERTGYQTTSTSAEVEELIVHLCERADHLRRVELGRTAEGRPITAVVAGKPTVATGADLENDSRLVVMLLGNIHSGECAGKEALLHLLRDVALKPDHPWLEHALLVVVPNYNADANDRRGSDHRPGQIGPEQMGLRANAQGLDLNRDFMKLDSPEARVLVRAIDQWNPHLFIDTHTTNGSRHRYALTYDVPHHPAVSANLRNYLRKTMMPQVTKQLKQQDVNTFFYGNFNRDHTRWTTYGYEPRYSTEYLGMRGRLAILAEAHSYITFEERIQATRSFVAACIGHTVRNRARVMKLLAAVRKQTIAAGRQPKQGDQVAVRAKLAPLEGKIIVEGYDLQADDKPEKDHEVDFYGKYEAATRANRPFAYLLPPAASRVADRLLMHGIQVEEVTEATEAAVQVYTAKKLERASRSYQNHRPITASVEAKDDTRSIPEQAMLVRTGQPLGRLAVQLLEPQAVDSLATWNFFDPQWTDGTEYPVWRVPAPVDLQTRVIDHVHPRQQLDLDQIYGPTGRVSFSGSFPSARWIPGTSRYRVDVDGRTYAIDAETGVRERYQDDKSSQVREAFAKVGGISAEDAQAIAGRRLATSSDNAAILVTHANDLFYYRYGEQRPQRLTHNPDREELAEFSPDGSLVAFVRNSDLYVVEVASGDEQRLTTGGSDSLLHGKLDWVYQEELYGRGNFKAFWWSPDSRHLALLELNQATVREYTVADHVPVRQSLEVSKYPKAGDPLPSVRLGVVAAVGGNVRWLAHEAYTSMDFLISRVDWAPDGKRVFFQVQNREQTWLDLCTAQVPNGRETKLFRETTGAWVSVLGPPRFLKDGSFVWESERSGNKHLYHVSSDGQKVQPITSGTWDVSSYYGHDPEEQWHYFLAFRENNYQAHGYRVKLDGEHVQRITPLSGSHSMRFNDDFSHFMDFQSGAHRPISACVMTADGQCRHAISPNPDDMLKYYELAEPEFMQIAARDGAKLDAMLIRPANFDPKKKYPVLVYTYSGPQAPTVRDRWGGSTYLWHQMLAQKGYVVWSCDNRSASMRGAKDAWPIHRNLGENELRDIEDGLNWLKKQPWIDGDRIGIWGWSYGGYMTAYALTHSKSFKVGLAGAPVTDWRNYDAIYTERYMGLPQTNEDGYRTSSVVQAANQLHGKLLLIHGTQDDNVHMGNTLQLVLELQRARKQFDLMLYPKNRHGVSQPLQSRHLREMMTDYILKNL